MKANITVSLSLETAQLLERQSIKTGKSKSNLVEIAIKQSFATSKQTTKDNADNDESDFERFQRIRRS